jgi:hypothetical protein
MKKKINLLDQREEKIEKRRREKNEIGLERVSEHRCEKAIIGDRYVCQYGSYVAEGDSYSYEGDFSFHYAHDPEEIKVSQDYVDSLRADIGGDEERRFMQCVGDKLGVMPEFSQCMEFRKKGDPQVVFNEKYGFGWYEVRADGDLSYYDTCSNATEIRSSLAPHYLFEKYEWELAELVAKIKAIEAGIIEYDSKEERDRVLGSFLDQTKQLEDKLPESKRKALWAEVQKNSLNRGFFFRGVGYRDGIFSKTGTEFAVIGTILSPIHEFLPDEMRQLERLTSEALYACTPPEHRVGKRERKLEYFD